MNKSELAKTINDNMTVIVRGVNERTESLCIQMLSKELNKKNIHLINESPFSTALKKAYKIGIAENRKWTVMIDADVLVRTGLMADLYQKAESLPRSVFTIQTTMLDKFFGGIRVGGVKVCRTKLLRRAYNQIPDVDLRPETFVNKAMHASGYYIAITDIVCGLHDFEQYYEDIFRKGFTHGIKHAKLANLLLPYWKRVSQSDKDFAVLLAGFRIGEKYDQALKLDKSEVSSQFKTYMKSAKLKEKGPLKKPMTLATVDKMLADFVPPPEFAAVDAEIERWGKPTIPKAPARHWLVILQRTKLTRR